MALFNVKTSHTITTQSGKPRNTLGYSGNPYEKYILNYSRNSRQHHSTLSFIRRMLGR